MHNHRCAIAHNHMQTPHHTSHIQTGAVPRVLPSFSFSKFPKKCSSGPVIIMVNKVIPEIFIIITIITSSSSLLVTSGNSVVNRVIAEIVVHLSKPATEGKNGPNSFMLTLLRFNDNDDGDDNKCKCNCNPCRHRQSA